MKKAFLFLSQWGNQKISADFYLDLHRLACSHFKGTATGTLMGQEKIGVFRGLNDPTCAEFPAPHYEIDQSGFTDFQETSARISLLFGSTFQLGEMVVTSTTPKTIRIQYQPMSEVQIRMIFNYFLAEFYYDINHADHEDAKLEAIAKFIQHLEWLHPPRDGCGRTDTALLNYLLTLYGFTPVIMQYPYVSSCKGLKAWVVALRDGMRAWKEACG